MRSLALSVCLLALLAAAPSLAAVPMAPIPTPDDFASLRAASDLSISPDGRFLAYALSSARFDTTARPAKSDNDAGWKRERQIWIVPVAGGEARQLTRGTERAGSPVWSPNGRDIAFLRKAGDKSKLHVIAVDGGEASVVSTGALEPTHVRWAPDGKSFAFLAAPETPKTETDEKWRVGGTVDYDHEWESSALWTVARSGGTPRQVSRGTDHIVDFAWSPDGSRFAVVASTSADPYEAGTRQTVRLIAADGAPIRVLDAEARTYEGLAWAPDGRRVALLTTEQSLSMNNRLEVVDVASGKRWNAAPDLERAMSSFVWTADSQGLIALIRHRTMSRLVRFAAAGGGETDLGFSGRVLDAPLTLDRAGHKLAFISSTDREPRDPTVFDLEAKATTLATRLNPQVANWRLGREETVRWKSENGIEVEGLLIVSPAAKPGVPAPLVVMPHGGPDDVSASNFGSLSQFLSSHGFSVFRPNYRGSFGYGREFYAANRGRLGEIEFKDIESGVDALIAAGKADSKRLFYGGWSWGGYLSAWTIGHTTRYRAAVVGAGVNDVFSQYALSDINHGVAAEWEYLGDPWRETDHFDRSNPIRSIRNAKTPTLIFHGQADERVSITASQILYRALSDLGVPTRLYTYPREPHNPQEPAHQVHRMKAWLEWYERWLKSSPTLAVQ